MMSQSTPFVLDMSITTCKYNIVQNIFFAGLQSSTCFLIFQKENSSSAFHPVQESDKGQSSLWTAHPQVRMTRKPPLTAHMKLAESQKPGIPAEIVE